MVGMVGNVFFSYSQAQENWEKNTSFLPGFKLLRRSGKGISSSPTSEVLFLYSICRPCWRGTVASAGFEMGWQFNHIKCIMK